jgi:hypothetical protein
LILQGALVAVLGHLSSMPLPVPLLQAAAGRDALAVGAAVGSRGNGGRYQKVHMAPTADHEVGASLCCTNHALMVLLELSAAMH